ncbi:MAG: GWxTD domain-containing protein [Ignavibacteriaceae bacterium]
MKNYLLTLIIIPYFGFAQPDIIPLNNPIEAEFHLFSDGDLYRGLYIYKIAYRNLVFAKEGDIFKAGFKIGVEVSDKLEGDIYREYNQHTTVVEDFNQTTAENIYLEGYLEFRIDSGSYNLNAIVNDLYSIREIKLNLIEFNTDTLTNRIGAPIIIKSETDSCDEDEFISFANYSADFPFSSENYSLLIPVFDKNFDRLYVEVINNEEISFTGWIDDNMILKFEKTKCSLSYGLKRTEKPEATKFFILKDISVKLMEGLVSVRVRTDTLSEVVSEFNFKVRWINKPRSLLDPEKSLEYLDLIESSAEVDKLHKVSKNKLTAELNKFWKKYDPSPETAYNELMSEFYKRIDYAQINFNALTNNNGAKSDRGKIYVRYGNPESIERFTDEYGRMMELWVYSNPASKFMFIDKKGTGNFTIINN